MSARCSSARDRGMKTVKMKSDILFLLSIYIISNISHFVFFSVLRQSTYIKDNVGEWASPGMENVLLFSNTLCSLS